MAGGWRKIYCTFAGIQSSALISNKQYQKIIESMPILCVDIIIMNSKGKYLLIKRANEPLKGEWWVIGGRVHKGETLEEAATRKVREETSLEINNPIAVGYYEDVNEKTPFGSDCSQHSTSIVFSAKVYDDQQIKLDYQSTDWKYSKKLPNFFYLKLFNVLE